MISTLEYDIKIEDGVVSFPMKELPNWYGIADIGFIWHGEWSDPELEYKGKRISCYIVEDTMWERYKEDGGHNVDLFGNYMRENADEVRELIELVLEGE
jgi:hypothetical protein